MKKVILSKSNILFSFLILTIIITGLTEPVLINNAKVNWENNLVLEIKKIEENIQSTFDDRNNSIISLSSQIKNLIRTDLENHDSKNCINKLSNISLQHTSIQVNERQKGRFGWIGDLFFENIFFDKADKKLQQTFFYCKKLDTYLSLIDTIKTKNSFFYISINVLIERHYKLANEFFEEISITNFLSQEFGTSISISFDDEAGKTQDGRKYSFNIRNNFNNKIGIAEFDKPALDNHIKKIEEVFSAIQSIVTLLIFLLIVFWSFGKIKSRESKLLKFFFIFVFLSAFRMFLFIFGIPSQYLRGYLTDPSNFSSVFAFGIVQSPIDLLITLLCLITIIVLGCTYLQKYFFQINNNQNNWFKFSHYTIISIVVFFVSFRGLGASLRSVVFDSTIRYFKEFALIPSPLILLMDFNILILGLCTVIVTVLLFKLMLVNIPSTDKKFQKKILVLIFVLFQLIGWIYDSIQKQPQGTPIIRIVFITIIFILVYLSIFKEHKTIYYLYYGFAASIISVSLLVYYNSEIERESLKTTAQEITRKNESIYQFIFYQTLNQFRYDDRIIKEISKNKNYSALTFRLWTESILYRENIPSTISIYNEDKVLLGKFSVNQETDEGFLEDLVTENLTDIKIYNRENIFTSKSYLVGVATLIIDSTNTKYIAISMQYDKNSFNVVNQPKFLSASRSGITSATEFDKLKIFFFSNKKLVSSYGGVSLDSINIKRINSVTLKNHNEAWLRTTIGNEQFLVYLLSFGKDNDKLIVVALEEKQFAWNLSNFFKVFFVHSLIIFLAFLITALWYIKKWKMILHAYRTKLSFAFIIVSVIPLIVVSLYIRYINEENNITLINNRLVEQTQQVDNIIKRYSSGTVLSEGQILEKAAGDLNINFLVYDYEKLIFSSYQNYFESGILPSNLSAQAYNKCVLSGSQLFLVNESIDRADYYSVYYKSTLNGKEIIISVNNIFNKINLPLSNVDLDIFLFGILSLALILLIIFSTILAEQISSPIRKLTLATRSVGNGDLNIEIENKSSGEVNELTNGFNMMVKKLKKSQIELAQLERETAWKEMAKQVAHEIKNPLTPMKLSVQQLIAAYNDKSKKFDEIFNKVTVTFINQIETLKNIASEFSNFARMPRLTIEKVNVLSAVEDTINLFTDEKMSIKFNSVKKEIFVNADTDHLNRTLINLIRNSIQANAKNINISINESNGFCEILVQDDGVGIEQKDLEKIFDENYTTKPQGMGLGLSMAKRFLESIGGNIIVESSSEKGTTFLITIPKSE